MSTYLHYIELPRVIMKCAAVLDSIGVFYFALLHHLLLAIPISILFTKPKSLSFPIKGVD